MKKLESQFLLSAVRDPMVMEDSTQINSQEIVKEEKRKHKDQSLTSKSLNPAFHFLQDRQQGMNLKRSTARKGKEKAEAKI